MRMNTIVVRPSESLRNEVFEIQKEEAKSKSQKSVLYLTFLRKFSADSTVHGVRYLFDSESFLIRKILWLLVFLACLGFCIQQFQSRITRFLGNDQNTDVQTIYVNQHEFPQIIICNNNIFKSSKVPGKETYLYLQTFFSTTDFSDEDFINSLALFDEQVFNDSGNHVNMSELYFTYRHDMESMLIDCTFHGQKCDVNNFTSLYTDYGVCYQFIGDGGDLIVTNAGSGTGLSMTINVEQYAYMHGPRFSAGILMSLHDPHSKAVPKIEGKAFNVPVGGEIFIGLGATKVTLIPQPKGECSNRDLRYFSEYSVIACQLECLTENIFRHCGCKNDYMPGNASLCILPVYYRCSYPYSRNFTQSKEIKDCDCPPACEESIFEPTMTVAPISDYSAYKLAATLAYDENMFLDYVKAIGLFEYNNKRDQRHQDQKAITAFSPPLTDCSAALALIYPTMNSTREMLTSVLAHLPQGMSSSSDATNSTLAAQIKIQNFINMMQSVDPVYYFEEIPGDDLYTILEDKLGTIGRYLFFNEYRTDVDESRNATEFLFLQQNFSGLVEDIENEVEQIVQVATLNGLSSASPILTELMKNLSEVVLDLRSPTSPKLAVQSSLDSLVNVGLKDLTAYASQNVATLKSLAFTDAFVKKNFMKVEIFFKEMRYQSVDKQLSDSITGLVCDLGGTFGLCLGASLMSVYELIDLTICYIRLRFSG